MDPITRRHIWNVIESAKHGRSIILTTHSMEEADILADRIGIMAKGRLRCIGNSTTLKSRFGAGFITKVSLDKGEDDDNTIEDHNKHHLAVKEFFKMVLYDTINRNSSIYTFYISFGHFSFSFCSTWV